MGIEALGLVPLRRGKDWLEAGQIFGLDKQLDASGDTALPADEAPAFEGQDHLMDGRRGDGKEALHIGFGGGAAARPSIPGEGALAEIHFHLSQQPVFPLKLRSILHRIAVRTQRTLKLADLKAVGGLGVSTETHRSLAYERTQEIGDAAAFVGFDGILAPGARFCR